MNSRRKQPLYYFFFKPSTLHSEALLNYAKVRKIYTGRFFRLQTDVRSPTESGPMYGHSQLDVSLSGGKKGEWALES